GPRVAIRSPVRGKFGMERAPRGAFPSELFDGLTHWAGCLRNEPALLSRARKRRHAKSLTTNSEADFAECVPCLAVTSQVRYARDRRSEADSIDQRADATEKSLRDLPWSDWGCETVVRGRGTSRTRQWAHDLFLRTVQVEDDRHRLRVDDQPRAPDTNVENV